MDAVRQTESEGSLDSMTKLAAEEAGRPPTDIPRIPINLYEHKVAIARHWTVLMVCSCFLPVALYFILKYVAHAKASLGNATLQSSVQNPSSLTSRATAIGVSSAIFGLVSLPSLLLRTWSLTKRNSTTRPSGASPLAMDYFNWNFLFGFSYITVLIVVSTVLKPAKPRIAALPLSLLLLQVCTQLLATTVLVHVRAPYPFRFSSMSRGDVARPALYTIIEDVVAVDGGQGLQFRELFNQRYLASMPIRKLLREMDLLWGVSGVAVAAALVGLIFKLHNEDISWIIGKLPSWDSALFIPLVTELNANIDPA